MTEPRSLSAPRSIRLGTRGSPLALAQAHQIAGSLKDASGGAITAEIVTFTTTGDQLTTERLINSGGKGLFTRELDESLTRGDIDIAVHSLKDVPAQLPDGQVFVAFPHREDPRDGFVSKKAASLHDLPKGARLGTASLRREAQALSLRPDLQVVTFRGNVQTRMRKLQEGVAEATLLAMAGLNRLGLAEVARAALEPGEMLPALAQGCIGIERRAEDGRPAALGAAIHDAPTGLRRDCERAIAGLAELEGGRLRMRGEILRPDGSEVLAEDESAAAGDGAALGAELARRLRARAPKGFFEAEG